jgi:hypothetical protein
MIYITLGFAIWLAFMIFATALAINPEVVKVVRYFVCPPDTEMIVKTEVYSYHHPGQKAIVVYSDGPEGQKDIKVRALLALWLFFFVLSIPVSIILVFWLGKVLASLS